MKGEEYFLIPEKVVLFYLLLTPIRPPVKKWVTFPEEKVEEELFWLLFLVHPMREDAVRDFLRKAHLNWEFIDDLLANKKIKRLSYQSYQYFMRKNVNREE
jgi:hypothetical protein